MEHKRASCPGWVWSCLCRTVSDWASVSVPANIYTLRCRRCGIVSLTRKRIHAVNPDTALAA